MGNRILRKPGVIVLSHDITAYDFIVPFAVGVQGILWVISRQPGRSRVPGAVSFVMRFVFHGDGKAFIADMYKFSLMSMND